jgi:hypothetical protein
MRPPVRLRSIRRLTVALLTSVTSGVRVRDVKAHVFRVRDFALVRRVKVCAARRGRTLEHWVTEALRLAVVAEDAMQAGRVRGVIRSRRG